MLWEQMCYVVTNIHIVILAFTVIVSIVQWKG